MIKEIIFDLDLEILILATPFSVYKYKYTSILILSEKSEFLSYANSQSEIILILVNRYKILIVSNTLNDALVY
jgi:hypothetical protein